MELSENYNVLERILSLSQIESRAALNTYSLENYAGNLKRFDGCRIVRLLQYTLPSLTVAPIIPLSHQHYSYAS